MNETEKIHSEVIRTEKSPVESMDANENVVDPEERTTAKAWLCVFVSMLLLRIGRRLTLQ
jgi:hypothetical protein